MVHPKRTSPVLVLLIVIGVATASPVYARGSQERQTQERETASQSTAPTEETALPEETEVDDAILAEMREILSDMGIQTFRSSIEAVDFSLPRLDGGTLSLSDMNGEFVFLNFWATWCPPCREEMPSMEVLYNELTDMPFRMVAVNVREDADTVQSFIDEFGYSYPILLDRDGTLSTNYGVRGIPTSFFIAPDGTVLGMLVGTRYWDESNIVDGIRRITEITAEL